METSVIKHENLKKWNNKKKWNNTTLWVRENFRRSKSIFKKNKIGSEKIQHDNKIVNNKYTSQ